MDGMDATSAPRRGWLVGPAADLLCGCGLGYALLVAVVAIARPDLAQVRAGLPRSALRIDARLPLRAARHPCRRGAPAARGARRALPGRDRSRRRPPGESSGDGCRLSVAGAGRDAVAVVPAAARAGAAPGCG